MKMLKNDIHEGALIEEDYISIPVSVFEELIRAETERDILEAVISGEHKYTVNDVMQAIQTARTKHRRGVLRIEINSHPFEESDTGADDAADTDETASDTEDPTDDEACE